MDCVLPNRSGKKNSRIPIVWGGVHPTIMPVQTAQNPYVDIVVKGQGEITFCELAKCLQAKGDLRDIKGIVFKQSGETIENESRPVADINDFPALPYHLLAERMEAYIKPSAYSKRCLPIITSDGCPFNCSFCYMSTPQFRRRYMHLSVERVLDEIEFLTKEYNIDGVSIRDSNFFIDIARTKAILEGLVRRNIKICITEVNVRADQLLRLDDDYWKLMEEAGIKEFLIGAESGDQEMLDLINKRITVEQIEQCEKKAVKYKINIINSFITGFPIRPADKQAYGKILNKELYKTIDLMYDIFKVNPLATNMLFVYTPYPGTPLYQQCLESGFAEPGSLEEWGELDLNQKHFPWMSDKHVVKVAYYEKLFLIKKLASRPYAKNKIVQGSRIYKILYYLGFLWALSLIAALRIRFKITALGFEKYMLN